MSADELRAWAEELVRRDDATRAFIARCEAEAAAKGTTSLSVELPAGRREREATAALARAYLDLTAPRCSACGELLTADGLCSRTGCYNSD